MISSIQSLPSRRGGDDSKMSKKYTRKYVLEQMKISDTHVELDAPRAACELRWFEAHRR